MAKVKVFAYAANADTDADGRAMTLAPRTFVQARLKIMVWCGRSCYKDYTCEIWKSYLL